MTSTFNSFLKSFLNVSKTYSTSIQHFEFWFTESPEIAENNAENNAMTSTKIARPNQKCNVEAIPLFSALSGLFANQKNRPIIRYSSV